MDTTWLARQRDRYLRRSGASAFSSYGYTQLANERESDENFGVRVGGAPTESRVRVFFSVCIWLASSCVFLF